MFLKQIWTTTTSVTQLRKSSEYGYFLHCLSSSHPPGVTVGGSLVVTPDAPFSVDDLTSDSIFYVQDSQRKAQATRDVFSFYISDGHSQTEAFSVEIDIQVAGVCVLRVCWFRLAV